MIWNIASRKCLITLLGHSEGILCLNKINDNHIVSGGKEKLIKIWDYHTGNCIYYLVCFAKVSSLVKLCKTKIAVGCFDASIKILDLETKKCVKTFHGHTNVVTSLIKLSNIQIASGSDNMIKIWELK